MAGVAGLESKKCGSHKFAKTCFCFVKISDLSLFTFSAKHLKAKKNEQKLSLIVPIFQPHMGQRRMNTGMKGALLKPILDEFCERVCFD